jgi:hypothetical protein
MRSLDSARDEMPPSTRKRGQAAVASPRLQLSPVERAEFGPPGPGVEAEADPHAPKPDMGHPGPVDANELEAVEIQLFPSDYSHGPV